MWADRPALRHCLRALTIVVASAGLSALIPATASAILFTSVTSPANDATFFVDQAQSTSSSVAFTATGTSDESTGVDLDCTSWNGNSVARLVTDTAVPNGAFAIPVTEADLATAANGHIDGPCLLSVVPTGFTPPKPGTTNTSTTGPLISISYETIETTDSIADDFYAQYTGTEPGTVGSLEFASPGDCGLEDGWITTGTTTLTESGDGFDCFGSLFTAGLSNDASVPIPAELTVDGTNAAIADSYSDTLPGFTPATVTDSYSNGELTLHDDEPVMLCNNICDDSTPPTAYSSSGIELDRTWQTEDNGLLVLQTDSFRSTDGKAHTVTADEDDDFGVDRTTHGSVDFPGTSGFLQYSPGDAIAPVSGPGSIYFKSNLTTADSGDPSFAWEQGAIAYTRAPQAPIVVTYWTNSTGQYTPEFYLPYTLQVPAGGSAALRFAYAQDFALSDVKTMAQQALAGFDPALTVSAPSTGATLATPQTTVTGTTTDAAGIKTLTVNGANVTVAGGGAFSDGVDLPVGANTITVVATDADGLSTTQTAAVTVAIQATTSLGTKIRRGKHHRYKLTGTLQLPAGVSATQGCTGKLTVTARHGRRKVGSATAALSSKCSWSAGFRAKHLKGHGKLEVAVVFNGNVAIKPFTPKVLKTKY